MTVEEPNAARIEYELSGLRGWVRVKVVVPGSQPFPDKLDVLKAASRATVAARITERFPALREEDVVEELERISAEVTEKISGADEEWAAPASDSVAAGLVRIARERYEFGRSLEKEPFAVPKDGPRIARPLRGAQHDLRVELASAYYEEHGTVPTSSALADALTVLEGDAIGATPEQLHVRVAQPTEGEVVLDLGDSSGRVVVITAKGWSIEDRSPVLFRRTELTGALPDPVQNGSLQQLGAFANLAPEAVDLATGFLVASLIPGIPHPIALMGGQQGTGKTTSARFMVELIDPSPAPVRSVPRDLEQWAVAAAGSWAIVIDNVSAMKPWLSDALCRAATGESILRRKLYTDGGLSVITFRRVVMLTSIDVGALRGDLGERLVLFDLEPITSKDRKQEKALRRAFEKARPALLGALLDLLSKVLAVLPTIELGSTGRMADFEAVLAAVDQVAGMRALRAYRDQRERVAREVVESDLVALAVFEFAREQGEWEGTAQDLLDQITPEKIDRNWPNTPRALAGAVRRVIPALEALGVSVNPPSDSNRGKDRDRSRIYHITLARQENLETTVRTVHTVQDHADRPAGADDVDGVDGRNPKARPCDTSDDVFTV